MKETLLIPAAERALRLVELLLSRSEGWTAQELLAQLDLSRSSLYQLLRTLKALGYVDQAGKRGLYSAGPRMKAWRATGSSSPQDLLVAFYQEATAQPLSETLALALPAAAGRHDRILVAAQVEGSAQVRSAYTPGQAYPDLTAATRILAAEVDQELATLGYALEVQGEAFSLALPVCRDGVHPEAVLLLTAPAFRWTADSLKAAFLDNLRGMAAHLSYRLGAAFYAPYHPLDLPAMQGTLPLSRDEIGDFLNGPWAASLACVRPDGKPHVIPVWQEWDGQDFSVIVWRGSQWADYLGHNPNVSLTVDEPWAPLRRVVVQGCAEPVTGEMGNLEALVQRLARRYLGQPAPSGLLSQVQGAFLIRPVAVRGWRGLPGGKAKP